MVPSEAIGGFTVYEIKSSFEFWQERIMRSLHKLCRNQAR
ncbi:hypothetical protein NEICINOT_04162 [Neisseria cinerea ATCC 14685]|uniref:Uncharacterized protein n=1 Tax=Neisseria cinerea ATCC 14685 TaxID=546262 RepID=D0W3C4_NEICI|nr:hypothetical protein NEICINOT_04162 [Neisseria cinerea ATCC 14685]